MTMIRSERIVDTYEGKNSSEVLRAKKDQLIAAKMTEYYKKVKQILAVNRTFLDKVTEELVEHKTLTQKDIKRIRAGNYR
ncbi:MAG: hypothetical protein IJR22_07260 [Acidaminococcaceae bacterium]|nr:hypothetical protein [Acidaminococcaceae bacterium]